MISSNSDTSRIVHITCRRGDSFVREFRFWADDAKTIPVDIETTVFKATVSRRHSDQEPVLVFENGNGFTITPPNILKMEKEPAQMLVQAGQYQYDIQQDKNGISTTIAYGLFIINDDITQ